MKKQGTMTRDSAFLAAVSRFYKMEDGLLYEAAVIDGKPGQWVSTEVLDDQSAREVNKAFLTLYVATKR